MNASVPMGAWLRLLREHGGPSPAYRKRLALLLLFNAAAAPVRMAERCMYAWRVAGTPIDPSPIFILGAARSGTTHLHNIMAHDPRLGVLTNLQAFAPGLFLSMRWLLGCRWAMAEMPRAMDNVAITLASPSEEEIAMLNLTHQSFMHCLAFPQHCTFLMHRYASLDALSRRELAHWDRLYLETLRKATWHAGGRRLLLKSPANTSRIPHLLRLFPEARFIHIVRSPYTLYPSLAKLFAKLTDMCQLQTATPEQILRNGEQYYAWTMRKYLQDRSMIAPDRLVEVCYEDLEREPLGALEHIYRQLGLPGWDDARAAMAAYLEGRQGYQKNVYSEDPSVAERVDRRWGFAVEAWGYAPPKTQSAP